MSGHTPGPWHVSEKGFIAGESAPTVYATDDELRYVAFCNDRWNEKGRETDNLANARLIAAAPELLNMLIKLRDAGSWYSSALEIDVYGKDRLDGEELEAELKALIDKATGVAA